MRNATLIALAMVFVLSLAGCDSLAPPSRDPLAGTTWVLTAYRDTSPIPSTSITATFEKGQVGGSAGCNSYSGSYQVSGDTITVGQIAITEMACLEPAGAMVQEVLFPQLLSDARTFRIADGKLQLTNSKGETLTFAQR